MRRNIAITCVHPNRFDLMVRMLCFVERGKPLLLPVDPLDLTPRCLIPGVEGRLRWRGI